jgi:hypothetical protein
MPSEAERLATLEAIVSRVEAHLENVERDLTTNTKLLIEMRNERKIVAHIVHWLMAIAAGVVGYGIHKIWP